MPDFRAEIRETAAGNWVARPRLGFPPDHRFPLGRARRRANWDFRADALSRGRARRAGCINSARAVFYPAHIWFANAMRNDLELPSGRCSRRSSRTGGEVPAGAPDFPLRGRYSRESRPMRGCLRSPREAISRCAHAEIGLARGFNDFGVSAGMDFVVGI